MTPEQAQQLANIHAAIGRVDNRAANIEAAASRADGAMSQGANVGHYWYWGQHVVVLTADGRMKDFCARKEGWTLEWDTGPGVCDPDGGITVNNYIDGALHVCTRSADQQAVIRMVYAPWEQKWRTYERIG